MDPLSSFALVVGEKVAVGAVQSLLKAAGLGIKKRFSRGEAEAALQAAVAEALAEALEGQALDETRSAHWASLFEDCFARDEAAIELAQLLDPRPDRAPDVALLAQEFRAAGFDPATLPGLDLDAFLRAFLSAFYAAAAQRAPLQAVLDLKLLARQLEQLGLVAAHTRRAADAGERSAATLGEIKDLLQLILAGGAEPAELRLRVEEARAEGFLAAYRTYEAIGAGLHKEGLDLGVNAAGVLEIAGSSPSALRELPPGRLEDLRLLAGELRQVVVEHAPSTEELDALEERYRLHVIRWFGNLTFQGMMRAPKPIVLPLEEVYVELRAVAEVPEAADAFSVEERRLFLEIDERDDASRRELMSQLDALRRERWSRTLPERKSMAEALHQRDRHAFVILGDPGSGKTTLLHFLALVYARGPETASRRLGVDPAEADRLPIFVPLAAFDDMLRESRRLGQSLTLVDFLPRYYDRRRSLPGLVPLFRRALASGRALLLFDGLDEVLDATTRRYVAQQASAFIGEWSARGVRFAVSSRFVGYREAPVPGLPTLSVLDFGMPEIETFVRRWAHAFEKWAAQGVESPEMLRRAKTLEAGLMEDVRSNDSVRRLAANPLLLTMLALLRRQVGRLPHRRVQLYESYVGTLLENWIEARSEGARESSIPLLDRHQAESILIPLAFWLQNEKPSGTAGRAEIRNRLIEICLRDRGLDPTTQDRLVRREAEEQAERFLYEMRQMAGLLIERGHDAFGFLHLTFQEYFAGRALAQLGDADRWEAIRRHLHDPRWREPLLLCAGRLGVVENRRPQVTRLVRDILDQNDPAEADLHRQLLLALAIACDDVNLEPGLVSELVEKALGLLETRVPALARELLRFLGQLIVNGMVRAELCLERVEAARSGRWRGVAIEEWGRFGEVPEIDTWLRAQLTSEEGWFVQHALEALAPRISEDGPLRQQVFACLANGFARETAARVLAPVVPKHPDLQQALLELLEKVEGYEQEPVLTALAGLVKSDAEVRRVFLVNLLSPYVSRAAVAGLAALAGSDSEARNALLAAAPRSREAMVALTDLVGTDSVVRRRVLEGLENPNLRPAAVGALVPVLGADAEALSKVAELLSHSRDAEVLTALRVCVPGIPCIQETFRSALESGDWRERRIACEELAESGAASRADLLAVLRNRAAREALMIFEACASAAEDLGVEWIGYWKKALLHSAPEIRSAAVVALRSRVDVDREIRQAVLAQLEDKAESVRGAALSALSGIVGEDEEVRRALLARLEDKTESVRESALPALAGIVGEDEEVRRAVLARLGDESPFVRESALSALSGIVGEDEEVRRAVLARLEDESQFVREPALSALSGIVGEDEEVRRAVLARLENESESVRRSAVSALSGIVGEDEEVRRAVLARLENESESVRRSAVSALSGIVGEDEEVRRAVLARLEDEAESVRGSAVSALSGIVGEDEEVRRAVLARLENKAESVRWAAVSALSGIVGTNEEVRRAVLARLEDESEYVRWAAVSALSGIGGADEEVRRAVLGRLEDRSSSVRLGAVELVAKADGPLVNVQAKLWPWLSVRVNVHRWYSTPEQARAIQSVLAKRFGARLPEEPALRGEFLALLKSPCWPTRLGAALALLAWPGGPPEGILAQVFAALEDSRGLEALPAQLTAASFLLNQNETAAEAIELCLEALEYGTEPWEDIGESGGVRRQAALVLGKLEPVFYDPRVYAKLLHVLYHDEDMGVRDAAYGTLVRLAQIRDRQGAGAGGFPSAA